MKSYYDIPVNNTIYGCKIVAAKLLTASFEWRLVGLLPSGGEIDLASLPRMKHFVQDVDSWMRDVLSSARSDGLYATSINGAENSHS